VTKEVLSNKAWHLYIISKSDKYYTGITTDLKNRLCQHGNPPLLYEETFSDKHQAAKEKEKLKVGPGQKKPSLLQNSADEFILRSNAKPGVLLGELNKAL